MLNAAQNLTPGGLQDDFSAEGVSQSIVSESIDVVVREDEESGEDSLAGLNRDDSDINTGSVEQDTQGMSESLELMEVQKDNVAGFSELGADIVGSVGREFNLNQNEKAILHGILGGIATKLGGGDIANGMISAIVNKYSVEYVASLLPDDMSQAEKDNLLRAFSATTGALIGYASGNSNNAMINTIAS